MVVLTVNVSVKLMRERIKHGELVKTLFFIMSCKVTVAVWKEKKLLVFVVQSDF